MIMIHQPVHPYVSREGWIDYHAAIAEAVPELGVVLYIRNERITGADIAALADRARTSSASSTRVRDASAFAALARDAGIDRFTWLAGRGRADRARVLGLRRAPASPRAWPTSPRHCRWPCSTRCAASDFGQAMKVWDKARRFEELRAADASADNVSVVKEALAQLGLCRARCPPAEPPAAGARQATRSAPS